MRCAMRSMPIWRAPDERPFDRCRQPCGRGDAPAVGRSAGTGRWWLHHPADRDPAGRRTATDGQQPGRE
ncbi:hypothetical protein G6F60_015155 [Rhizopus arrhizus]|nr:hypothetical protein G6F61_015183 [Rhizopus arrhizus]KAG1381502.1 hypothetical protein G6F60_015155 [Rhizopus arrhizus]